MSKKSDPLTIEVCAHWEGFNEPAIVGHLYAGLIAILPEKENILLPR